MARALFDQLMNHGRRLLQEGDSYQQTQQFRLAQRVTRNNASNVQLGCSLRSELKLDVVGRDVPAHPGKALQSKQG